MYKFHWGTAHRLDRDEWSINVYGNRDGKKEKSKWEEEREDNLKSSIHAATGHFVKWAYGD
jgi:hypothetical protein